MNIRKMTIEDMCFTTEKQEFDRKSARITAATIATPMIARLRMPMVDCWRLALKTMEKLRELMTIYRISMRFCGLRLIFAYRQFVLKHRRSNVWMIMEKRTIFC